jgi:hypothetical protein
MTSEERFQLQQPSLRAQRSNPSRREMKECL